MKTKSEMKAKRKQTNVFRFIYFLFLTVFILSGGILTVRLLQMHQGKEFYQKLRTAGWPSPAVSPGTLSPKPTAARFFLSGYPRQGTSSRKTARFPYQIEPAPFFPDLTQLTEIYPDIAAWLQIPGTSVDYPVMLGLDNQFYLNHLPDKSFNPLGSLFLDFCWSPDSPHSIIYGHNGAGGAMFGLLEEYESPDYYAAHPSLIFTTPDAFYICPIFSVRRVEADSDAYTVVFEDSDAFPNYLRQAAAESLYPIDVDFCNAEKILTLSTCTEKRNQRLVIQAICIRHNQLFNEIPQ